MSRSNGQVWTEWEAYPEDIRQMCTNDFVNVARMWMLVDEKLTFAQTWAAMWVLRPLLLPMAKEIGYLREVVDIQREEIEQLRRRIAELEASK